MKNILNDKNCERMTISVIVNFVGELYVKKKLEEELGADRIRHKGKQCRYDEVLDEVGNVQWRIDVKTSRLIEVKGIRLLG